MWQSGGEAEQLRHATHTATLLSEIGRRRAMMIACEDRINSTGDAYLFAFRRKHLLSTKSAQLQLHTHLWPRTKIGKTGRVDQTRDEAAHQ